MIKKWMWVTPLTIGITAAVTGAVVGGCLANQNANPYRTYYATPVGYSNSDLMQVYLASIVNGTRLLLLPGYIQNSPLTQALGMSPKTNELLYNYINKAGFILLDDSYGLPIFNQNNQVDNTVVQPVWSTQVASVSFRADLGSFITGIAAAEFLNEYQYYFAPNDNDKLTWATYGGATYDSVVSFMGGLQKGIRWFNKNIVPHATTKDGKPYKEVEQVFVGHEQGSNFVNGFGLTDGNQLINLFLDQKVDMLIPVAGSQTQQAVRLIKQKGTRTIVLGVDSAGENDTNSNLSLPTPGTQEVNGSTKIGGTDKIIQFSSVKKMDSAGSQIMQKINDNKSKPDEGKTIGGFGYQSLGTTENDCVGVSEAGYPYFIKAMEIFNSSKNNVRTDLDSIFDSVNNMNESELKTKYQETVKNLENQDFFKQLSDPKNMVYYTYSNWTEGTVANKNDAWSYAGLPLKGKQMMPLHEDELDNWFKTEYLGQPESYSLSQDEQTKLDSLHAWFKQHQQEIKARQDFNLANKLTKEEFEVNPSIAKVVVNTPDTPLLDKGFCQSTYMGLVEYWKEQKINIPIPVK